MKQHASKWIWYLVAVLLFLTLLSTHLLSGLYARYTSVATGSDSARVAKFDVQVTGPEDIEIFYGGTGEGPYDITVVNNSEVAVACNMDVVVSEINFGITVTLNGTPLSTSEAKTLPFGKLGEIAPGGTATYDMTFAVQDWGQFTQAIEGTSREHEVTFTMYIDVVQVD